MKLAYIATYTDGSEMITGSWEVPHDQDYFLLNSIGGDIGAEILHEYARQDPLPVVKIEIVPVDSERWKEATERAKQLMYLQDHYLIDGLTEQTLYQKDRITV